MYTFTTNDSFIFAFEDQAGNTGTATATVDWIDKIAPIITNITSGQYFSGDITPSITEAHYS